MLMLMVSSNAPYNALYNTLQGTLAILQFRNFWKQDQTTTPELHSYPLQEVRMFFNVTC